jgi:hypothetical protein
MLLFFEDHLATIDDLDAVKACHLASTADPVSTIGINAAWHFGSLTLASSGLWPGLIRLVELKVFPQDQTPRRRCVGHQRRVGEKLKLALGAHPVAVEWSHICWRCPDSRPAFAVRLLAVLVGARTDRRSVLWGPPSAFGCFVYRHLEASRR